MANIPKTRALVTDLRTRGIEVLTHDDYSHMPRVYVDRLQTRPHDLLPHQPADTLINHITVTHDHGPLTGHFTRDLATLEDVGWRRFRTGISYDLIVDQNAPRPRVAIGQFLEARGAHAINDKNTPGYSKDQNKVSIGVAWIGVPGDRLNEHAITAMVELRRALITIGALTTHYDDIPHSLLAYKDCPTDELRDRLPDLRRRALAGDPTPRTEDDMTPQQARQLGEVHDLLTSVIDHRHYRDGNGDLHEAKLADTKNVRYLAGLVKAARLDADQLADAIATRLDGRVDRETVKAGVLDALRAGTDDDDEGQ